MSEAPILRTYAGGHGVVYGGLQMLRGNRAPYFSLTYWYKKGQDQHGGAGHDEILRRFPELADLARLHLSDITGVPMHALENGFYYLGGTHWQRPDFAVAARHFRIPEAEARQLVRDLFGPHFSETGGFMSKGEAGKAKARLAEWVEAQKPRWGAEAQACIEVHHLRVYGDPWQELAPC